MATAESAAGNLSVFFRRVKGLAVQAVQGQAYAIVRQAFPVWLALPDQASVLALNEALWNLPGALFVPHGLEDDPDAQAQPLILSAAAIPAEPVNQARTLWLIAPLAGERSGGLPIVPPCYERLIVTFGLNDPADEVRALWQHYKSAGVEVNYKDLSEGS